MVLTSPSYSDVVWVRPKHVAPERCAERYLNRAKDAQTASRDMGPIVLDLMLAEAHARGEVV